MWASFKADLALFNVFTGKLPAGAPPAGPQKSEDFTLLYFPTLEPPGFFLAFLCLGVSLISCLLLYDGLFDPSSIWRFIH